MAPVDERIYGHFLEHINHSVVDGLYAEQIRGQGFEGDDFETYWETFARPRQRRESRRSPFENGTQERAAPRRRRHAPGSGRDASSSRRARVRWIALGQAGGGVAAVDAPGRAAPKANRSRRCRSRYAGSEWQEVGVLRSQPRAATRRPSVEIAAAGNGTLLLDYVSLMRADVRASGMLRPDLRARPCEVSLRPSSAGPGAPSPPSTSGRTASARRCRAAITPTRSGATTPTTTASAPTSSWSSAGSSTPSR